MKRNLGVTMLVSRNFSSPAGCLAVSVVKRNVSIRPVALLASSAPYGVNAAACGLPALPSLSIGGVSQYGWPSVARNGIFRDGGPADYRPSAALCRPAAAPPKCGWRQCRLRTYSPAADGYQ